MTFARRVGWMLIGVVIGALGAAALGAVPDQGSAKDAARLVFKQAPMNRPGESAFFVNDTKSSGCWLALYHGNGGAEVSLAPAPSGACFR